MYNAEHWLLPVASRVYILVGRDQRIIFRQDEGVFLLKDQTKTLIRAFDLNQK